MAFREPPNKHDTQVTDTETTIESEIELQQFDLVDVDLDRNR